MNFLRPVITSPVTKEIAKGVLNTGIQIGSDVLSGKKSFKESATSNLRAAKKKVAKTVLQNLTDEDSEKEEVEDEEFTLLGFPKNKTKPPKRKNISFNPRSKKRKIIDF